MRSFLSISFSILLFASFAISDFALARTWHVPSEVSTIDAAIDFPVTTSLLPPAFIMSTTFILDRLRSISKVRPVNPIV